EGLHREQIGLHWERAEERVGFLTAQDLQKVVRVERAPTIEAAPHERRRVGFSLRPHGVDGSGERLPAHAYAGPLANITSVASLRGSVYCGLAMISDSTFLASTCAKSMLDPSS